MACLNQEEMKKIFRSYKDCYDIIQNMIMNGVCRAQLEDLETRLEELFRDHKIGLMKATMLNQKFAELVESVKWGSLPDEDIEEILTALSPAKQKVRDSLDLATQNRLACNK